MYQVVFSTGDTLWAIIVEAEGPSQAGGVAFREARKTHRFVQVFLVTQVEESLHA